MSPTLLRRLENECRAVAVEKVTGLEATSQHGWVVVLPAALCGLLLVIVGGSAIAD